MHAVTVALREQSSSSGLEETSSSANNSPEKSLSPRTSYLSDLHLPPIDQKSGDEIIEPIKEVTEGIKLLCMTCEEEIRVQDLKIHREFHRALQIFRYTMDNKPNTVKQLVTRRRSLMRKLNENANFENPVSIRKLQKLNAAYELLKSNLVDRWGTLREVALVDPKEYHVMGQSTLLNCALAFGICEDKNSRWKTTMEDRHTFCDYFCNDPQSGFFAVFDGYNGATAAGTSAKTFPEVLARKVESVYRPGLASEGVDAKITTALRETYEDVDRILLYGVDEDSRNRWSGCSAVTCLLRGNKLYIANAGNVRAVLCKGDGSMIRLTQEHTPRNKRERHRVSKYGEVYKSEKTALVNGLTTNTRGLGNHGDPHLKSSVICQPSVNCVTLDEADQFVILATNGVWEVFSEEEVILLLEDLMPELDVKEIVRRMNNASEKKSKVAKQCNTKRESAKTTGSSQQESKSTSASSKSSDTISIRLPEIVSNKGKAATASDSLIRMEEKAQELAKALSERLVQSALMAGSKDNTTVAVILLKGCPLQMFLLPSLRQ
ncbi:predicted protein [Nematostella vectensis]|uniref:PPM-type phosphatase domain-containing protein n=1 Tax=Nematostella vectensis TaxID=45351 RepID=A7SAI4_NEMVE|nr:protein phosphatase 2C-like domain-containing protein 1 [Nematostella vectensis]EDO39283.1 predicted protein [Nematostella vectensis]|eukprot:XP_001631346.1 predicted protein [Nematostella vectensis]